MSDHYNYFRDFDPSTGRYVESDPLGLAAGLNTYAYVGGNPLARIDPRGLESPTNSDLLLCASDPIACIAVNQCRKEALQATKNEYSQGGHNDEPDAFRHCYWSCCMAKKLGGAKAANWGLSHERDPKNPECERNMDLFNNWVGLGVAGTGANCKDCKQQPLQKQPIGSCSPCGYKKAYGY